MKSRIAVVGGGVAGITAAIKLARETDASVDLIERSEHPGGLLCSAKIGNLIFDIGPFFFRKDNAFFSVFPEVLSAFVQAKPTLSKISQEGIVDKYPFSIRRLTDENGVDGLLYLLIDRFYAKTRYLHPTNVYEWVVHRMGNKLYEVTGLRHYLQRSYNIDSREIDVKFALQRMHDMKNYTVPHAIAFALRKALKSNSAQTPPLFIRPTPGFQSVFNTISKTLRIANVNFIAPAVINSIHIQNNSFILDLGGYQRAYSGMISTIPLSNLLALLGEQSSASYMHLNLVSMFYQGELNFPGDVLFNYSKLGKWRRLTSFSRLYNSSGGRDYFTVETTVRSDSTIDVTALRHDFEQHTKDIRLVKNTEFLGNAITPLAYPVNLVCQSTNVERDKLLINNLGIFLAGRQGQFVSLSTHKAALQAAETVQAMLSLKKNVSYGDTVI
jgi:hypothetical protein